MKPKEIKGIVNGIFEAHDLTRVGRSGWKKIGIKNPENIAEHAAMTAQIAYILAVLEEAKNPERIACMCLFHDNAETRIGDPNKITTKYIDKKIPEMRAFQDFSQQFPKEIKKRLGSLFLDFERGKDKESIIAKDADMLQLIFQAKYYLDIGFKIAKAFIDNTGKKLQTESAKTIFEVVRETEFTEWLHEKEPKYKCK